MIFSLQNRQAAVTGGGSGIGQAVATTLARHGATVHVLDINAEAAAATAEAIRQAGGQAIGQAIDVTDQAAVVALFDTIPHLDLLVNCAGISHIGKATTTPEPEFERVFRVNVQGVYNCLFGAIPKLQATGGGVIVNVSSVAAHVGLSDRFAYAMSKGAVHAMTLSVAKDYLADGIRCNSVSPGRVHTPFVDGFLAKNYPGQEAEMYAKLAKTQPIGRMGQPQEIANLILYLCSDEASFITGTDFPIDGGFLTLNT